MKFLVVLSFVALALSLSLTQSCQPCVGVSDGGEPRFRASWKSLEGRAKCYDGKVYVTLNPETNFARHGGYGSEGFPYRQTSYSAYPLSFQEASWDKKDAGCQAYFPVVANGHGVPEEDREYQYLFRFATQSWGPGYPDPSRTEPHTRRTNRFTLGLASCCMGENNPCGESSVDLTGTGLALLPLASKPADGPNYFVTSGWPNEARGPGRATQLSAFKFTVTGGDYCGDTSPIHGNIYVAPLEYQGKVRICHRTNAVTNPYTSIEVSWNAVDGDTIYNPTPGDHRTEHTGPIFDPNFDYPANEKNWGDIIPPIEELDLEGVNWSIEGQKIWNNDCNFPQTETPFRPAASPKRENSWEDIWNDISCGKSAGGQGAESDRSRPSDSFPNGLIVPDEHKQIGK